jgi:hypothetical protein
MVFKNWYPFRGRDALTRPNASMITPLSMQRCGLLFFLSSGIGQQRWHLPAAVIGNPRLLQEWQDVAALLSQRGGDGEQSAAADGALAGLDAMADLALNNRLAQGTLGGVVGWFDAFDF